MAAPPSAEPKLGAAARLATVADYQATISDENANPTPVQVTLLGNQIEGVSDYLIRELGRDFNVTAAEQAREFDGNGTRLLTIHDCAVTPSLVRMDSTGDGTYDTTIDNAHWRHRPLNALRVDPPIAVEELEVLTASGAPRCWLNTVEVTAQWGWAAIPRAIVDLTIQITALLRADGPRSTTEVQDIGSTIGASDEAQDLITRYGAVFRRHPSTESRSILQAPWFA